MLLALLGGREAVVFLAPLGAHNAIAVEAWQVVDQWDLQTVDGTVNAVRYGPTRATRSTARRWPIWRSASPRPPRPTISPTTASRT